MDSKEIARIFRDIGQILELKGENIFRVRAYERAAAAAEELGERLQDMIKQDTLTSVPGIGTDLASKIKEIFNTGSLKYYEELKRSFPEEVIRMLEIPGLGPKTVKLIYETLHIDTIEKLQHAAQSGKLKELGRIREKTERNILRGIEIFKKGQKSILLYDAVKIAGDFLEQMKKNKAAEIIEVAGSLRRKKSTVKDIDILVVSKKPLAVMDEFVGLPMVSKVLAKGLTKSSVIAKDKSIQVDLRVVDKNSFGSALLYFTGSKEFNIKLRHLALKSNYTINEYGVFPVSKNKSQKKGGSLAGKTEKEIFSLMKMPYIPPELREDRGELEAALKRKLPSLVKTQDIKGDLHVHSRYSDGKNTIEEIVSEAVKMKYEYIGISDHSQGLKIAGGLNAEAVYKKLKETKKIDKKFKNIRVLCGVEVDIDSSGRLDYPDRILKEFDFVIAAIHSGFKQSREQLTERIISACRNRYVNIIAHPTGVLWGVRDPYDIDIGRIVDAAKNYNVALEINCNPERLDLNSKNVFAANKSGAEFFLGSDAHSIDQLQLMSFGINVARRGWLGKKDIINSMTAGRLAKWLKK